MTIMIRKTIGALSFAVTMAMLLTLAGAMLAATPVVAQTDAAKPNTPPSKAEQSLNRGIAAYKKNALARAVGAFSSALSSGGLDTAGTARALYYRGMAYRRQGLTALAITDLTNALWLNNGLNETERADAVTNRAAAYKSAGIADPGAPQAEPASAPVMATAAAPSVASAPAPSAASPTATAALAPSEAAPAATGNSNPFSGIGSFFGNLFSGGSSSSGSSQQAGASKASSSEMTTASTGAVMATSSWNSSTQVGATANLGAATSRQNLQHTAALKDAPVATDATPAGLAAPLKGKFKLQLAAVRSRAKAEELAQRFTTEHGTKSGGRTPVIEEAVFGNMGTFYRVNIGPYASAAEPDKLCHSLRASGFDCLVVTH